MSIQDSVIEQARIAHNASRESGLETFKSVITASFAALRTFMTINAGGIIALLAFIGTIAGKDRRVFASIDPFILPMTLFGLGLICSAIAFGGVYFSQACFAHSPSKVRTDFEHPYVHPTSASKRWQNWGIFFQFFNIAFGLASLSLFIFGIYFCREILMTAKL